MEDLKHTCKFCTKSFPCGRSLGGHMRSHLINISSKPSNPRKKILPSSISGDDGFGYGLRANPRKTNKALTEGNLCKECGKSFQSVKALFGHMKCHSVHGRSIIVEEDSWDSCDNLKQLKKIVDSQSDNEAASGEVCRKKRSDRVTRYSCNNNSSTFSSEIEQQEQEEVALSLIILSHDKGDWFASNSAVESSDNSSKFIEFDELNLKTRNSDADHGIGCNESEVDSGRNSDMARKNKARKIAMQDCYGESGCEFLQDSDKKISKFTCSICKKGFPSYQALGGHRASHKKFKGCCAPRSENSHETEQSQLISENPTRVLSGWLKSKEHECPVCFKVFPSGQALGGHKRSHLISNPGKSIDPTVGIHHQPDKIRQFLDLNLPAPDDDEECNEFKPWWIEHEPMLSLLSS